MPDDKSRISKGEPSLPTMLELPGRSAPPAIVVGLCAHGLAVVRDLARAGIRVIALESNPRLPGFRTRLAEVRASENINAQSVIAELVDLKESQNWAERPILFPTNDNMVRLFAENWPQLERSYRLSWSGCRDRIIPLLSKDNIEARCRAAGLPYPESVTLATQSDIYESSLQGDFYPAIIKPVRPLSAFKALRVESVQECLNVARRFPDAFPLLLQRWIGGGDTALYFCAMYLDHGRVVADVVGRKLASLPRAMGQTTAAEVVWEPEVREQTLRFFNGLNLSGPVSLEVKMACDGTLWVIEPTVGRSDYWVDLCVAGGVRLPLIEFTQQTMGTGDEVIRPSREAVWLDTEREPLLYLQQAWQVGSFSFHGRSVTFPYLHNDDLLPFGIALFRLLYRIGSAFRTRLRFLWRYPSMVIPHFSQGDAATLIGPGADSEILIEKSIADIPTSTLSAPGGARSVAAFSSKAWFSSVEKHLLRANDDPIYLISRGPSGNRVVMPLMIQRSGLFGAWKLKNLANFYAASYSYLADIDIDEGELDELLKCIPRYLIAQRSPFPKIELAAVGTDPVIIEQLVVAFRGAGYSARAYKCYANWRSNVVPGHFTDYLEGRPGFLRNLLIRKAKRLTAMFDVEYRLVTDTSDLQGALDAYDAVYQRSWKTREPFPNFIRDICTTWAREGKLRLGLLFLNGKPVAAQIWLIESLSACLFKLAYDREFKKHSVGSVLMGWLIRHFIDEDRVSCIDFLTGDDGYKQYWADTRDIIWGVEALDPRHWMTPLIKGKRLLQRWASPERFGD